MNQPTQSNLWYRVADLHPRLRAHVRVKRQLFRGDVWYLLTDSLRGRNHRLNGAAYGFLGRCDGERSVRAIRDVLLDLAPDEAPTQNEIVTLLIQLNRQGLLQCEQTPDVEQLFRAESRERGKNRLKAMNPLSFKIALFNPSSLLERLDPIGKNLFSRSALLLWSIAILAGLLAAISNWATLEAHVTQWMPSVQGMFLMWIAFPVVKAIHELAHGMAIRRWGGEVHEAGLSLLALTPVPFVDASSASAFADHRHRVIVSAAGIMAELLLASLALLLWSLIQPGLVRDICLAVAMIGSLSTLLINGNPLLKFDGYFILTDALQLPNLHPRGANYWRYLLLRYGLALKDMRPPDTARGEKRWLIGYPPVSWAYRVALGIALTTWIGGWSSILGTLAAIASIWMLLIGPLHGFLQSLKRQQLTGEHRSHLFKALAAWAVVLIVLLGMVPLPFATVAQGVVWPPEQAQIRPESGGFIERFVVPDGALVSSGDLIVSLTDPELLAKAEELRKEILRSETEFYRQMPSDPVMANNTREQIDRLRDELADRERRIEGLQIRAGVSGRLAMPRQADHLGSYAPRGQILGHIVTGEPAKIRVAVSQDAASLVRSDTRSVAVLLAEHPFSPIEARLAGAIPAATNLLPSAALGDRSNGPHVVDPADQTHRKTHDPVFVFDIALPIATGERIGGRAWVRFEHTATPLASQWARAARQLVLRAFDAGG